MAPRKREELSNTVPEETNENSLNKKTDIINKNVVNDMDINKNTSTNDIITNIYKLVINFIKLIGKIILNFIIGTFKISIIYLSWIVMHYTASHMYTKFCVPETWYGFLISPLLTSTPHCQGLRWIVYNGANTINSMWILIGTWLCSKIIFTTQAENMPTDM